LKQLENMCLNVLLCQKIQWNRYVSNYNMKIIIYLKVSLKKIVYNKNLTPTWNKNLHCKNKVCKYMAFEKPIESLLKQCKICKLMHISGKLSYQVKTFNVTQFYVGFCCYFTSICNHFW